jgi:hypothetical protein
VLLGLIIITFLITMYVNQTYVDNLEKMPDFNCNEAEISSRNATADYHIPLHQRQGDYHCFCDYMF